MDYQAWIIDQTGEISCPGGENRNDFRSRVQTGFSRLLEVLEKEAIESACMVCHGGTIAEIMAYVRPEEKNFYEWQPNSDEVIPMWWITMCYIHTKQFSLSLCNR